VGKVYHDLRRTSPEAARLLVRKVLEQNGGNVSKTARILGISRKTVRRAKEGPLPREVYEHIKGRGLRFINGA